MSAKDTHLMIKISALREVASGIQQELDAAEKKLSNPAPANRKANKEKRIKNIAAFYAKRKINQLMKQDL